MSWFRRWLPVLAVSLALLFACDSQEEEQPPGIILGKSIAGIEIGMDSTDVKERLGRPDEIIRGDYPGVIFEYSSGEFAGLEIEFSGLPEFGSGVASICSTSPYGGKSSSGWGIGSPFAVPEAELADSLYSYGISGTFWAQLLGEGQFPATYFYNYGRTVLELELLLDSEEQIDVGTLPLDKICFQAMPVDRDWRQVTGHPGKYFRSQAGITQRFADECLHATTFEGHWQLECFLDVWPAQRIPADFQKPDVRIMISGYQAPKRASLFEWSRLLIINTIYERKRNETLYKPHLRAGVFRGKSR